MENWNIFSESRWPGRNHPQRRLPPPLEKSDWRDPFSLNSLDSLRCVTFLLTCVYVSLGFVMQCPVQAVENINAFSYHAQQWQTDRPGIHALSGCFQLSRAP